MIKNHIIIGYGYCGYYLAKALLTKKEKVTAIARHQAFENAKLEGLNYLSANVEQPMTLNVQDAIIYYLIPPPKQGQHDGTLQTFIQQMQGVPEKIIYFGSSGVYGDQQGSWVDESSACNIKNNLQRRRLDAEAQWLAYAKKQNIPCIILRTSGIFGPGRLPLETVRQNQPIIKPEQAPWVNHIYVKDLVQIALLLSETCHQSSIYNISDGQPLPMGSLASYCAEMLNHPPLPMLDFDEIWAKASPMKKNFLSASKRLSIQALKSKLGDKLQLSDFKTAVKSCIEKEGTKRR
jgi:nucleoside-diphosphate-sugar epimerase